jgi:hypothetical protein
MSAKLNVDLWFTQLSSPASSLLFHLWNTTSGDGGLRHYNNNRVAFGQ